MPPLKSETHPPLDLIASVLRDGEIAVEFHGQFVVKADNETWRRICGLILERCDVSELVNSFNDQSPHLPGCA